MNNMQHEMLVKLQQDAFKRETRNVTPEEWVRYFTRQFRQEQLQKRKS